MDGASVGKQSLNTVFKDWFQVNYGNRKPPKLSELEEIMNKKFGNRNSSTNKWINIKIKQDEEQNDLEDIE
jgi:hypothetical protein